MSRQQFLLLTAGFLIASVVLAPLTSFRGDVHGYWVPWEIATVKWRPWNAYSAEGCNYPPVILYVLSVLEAMRNALSARGNSPTNLMLLKLPSVCAQLVGAVAIFRSLRREFGTRPTLWIAACWLVTPGLFVNTAVWCQWDAFLALFGLLALLTFRENRPMLTGAYVALAVATKVQAIFLLPVLGIVMLARRNVRALGLMATGAALAAILCFAPMAAKGRLRDSLRVYVASVDTFPNRSVNAWNPWSLMQSLEARDAATRRQKERNLSDALPLFPSLSAKLTYKRVGLLMFAAYMVPLLVVVARRRSQLDVLVGTPLCGIAMFILLTQMHERYSAAPAAMMVLWLPLGRRYQVHFWYWSISSAINQLFVLGRYGYLGEIEPLMDASFDKVAGVVAVLNVAAFAHLTWLFYRPRAATPAPLPPEPVDPSIVPTVSRVA